MVLAIRRPAMPWREVSVMEQRREFVRLAMQEGANWGGGWAGVGGSAEDAGENDGGRGGVVPPVRYSPGDGVQMAGALAGRSRRCGPVSASAWKSAADRKRDRATDRGGTRWPSGLGSSQDCAVPEARGYQPAGGLDGASDPAPFGSYQGPVGRRGGKPALRDAGAGPVVADGRPGVGKAWQ